MTLQNPTFSGQWLPISDDFGMHLQIQDLISCLKFVGSEMHNIPNKKPGVLFTHKTSAFKGGM